MRGGGSEALTPPPTRVAVFAVVGLLLVAAPGSAATVDERVAPCLACHGPDGQSSVPQTPSLGAQPQFFVIAQLFLFREGRRDSQAMTQAAKGLTNDDLRAFAERISKLPPPPPPATPADPTRVRRARALAQQHHCVACHHPDFSGRDQIPRLANQREDYLLKTMREYKRGSRIGYGGAMTGELVGLADADLVDLAHFLAHLPRPASDIGRPR